MSKDIGIKKKMAMSKPVLQSKNIRQGPNHIKRSFKTNKGNRTEQVIPKNRQMKKAKRKNHIPSMPQKNQLVFAKKTQTEPRKSTKQSRPAQIYAKSQSTRKKTSQKSNKTSSSSRNADQDTDFPETHDS